MHGWLLGINVSEAPMNQKRGLIDRNKNIFLFTNLLNKFYNDTVKVVDKFFIEGFITNKEIILNQPSSGLQTKLKQYIKSEDFPNKLRGSFCGYYMDENGDICIFTDHIASKNLFYYYKDGQLIVSTRLEWICEILRRNEIEYSINEMAAKYMLTYGYMLDDSTFVTEIKRVMPGNKIVFRNGNVEIRQYHKFSLQIAQNITEDEAIEQIDKAFRIAIKREFEKDREYGYKHLVDLSGGLDSRMVTWVAHELGYEKQTNFVYCKSDYLDFKISSHIAKDLKHEFMFKQLDDLQWVYEIDELSKLNNGMALYSGITGGKQFLENLNQEMYGIEHTGMLGDVILSCYAHNLEEAVQKPAFGLRQYSTRLKYEYNSNILAEYENQEIFDIYTRGFLGILSTYSVRQNYFEVASPFLDVDFINTCFNIPVKYRINHNIYLKWMNKYYNKATKYGWEKWCGICPKEELRPLKTGMTLFREVKRHMRYAFGYKLNDSMNPFEYWYEKDSKLKNFFDEYFKNNMDEKILSDKLRNEMTELFLYGTCLEKTQVLTVLSMIKICF